MLDQARASGITFLTDEMAKADGTAQGSGANVRKVAVIFNPQHFDDEVTFARRGPISAPRLTTHPINKIADLDAALQGVGASGAVACSSSRRAYDSIAAKIAQHGQERRLPVITSWREFADSGRCCPGPSRILRPNVWRACAKKVLNVGEAGRFAYRATCEIRTCYQSQNR
ncbi:hypothetical protein [Bradyrhizobium sp. RDI18]|uniref:hypothetical protein n=1 Tax=Bradyrhizobium sp. RDI18 TaxID=3367400 RepID=UPI0037130CD6